MLGSPGWARDGCVVEIRRESGGLRAPCAAGEGAGEPGGGLVSAAKGERGQGRALSDARAHATRGLSVGSPRPANDVVSVAENRVQRRLPVSVPQLDLED